MRRRDREYIAREKANREEREQLTEEITAVQEDMAATLKQFSATVEPELLDYYTYCYKANQIKHSYLIKKLKRIYYNKDGNKDAIDNSTMQF